MRSVNRLLLCILAIPLGSVPLAAVPQAEMIVVTMEDYDFTPSAIVLKHDVRYRLHLQNHGKETHEFTAPVFFRTAELENPDVLDADRTQVTVQPGESKDLFLTAHRPGAYDLRCADHDWAGMVGGITVE